MEAIADDIRRFLTVEAGDGSGDGSGYGYSSGDGSGSGSGSGDGYGSGDGDGDGDGSGYGDGSGSGSGYGDGDGYGSGDGDGSGSGSGYGSGSGSDDGIELIDGARVYQVDGTPTIIGSVHTLPGGEMLARGSILRDDLTLTPTYIARVGDSFAHALTAKTALEEAREKWEEDRPLEDRIADFVVAHPDLDTPYGDLFRWHHILTGSCTQGRLEWCRAHGLQPTDSLTVREFIRLTKDSYGGSDIKQLAKSYAAL